MSPTAQLALATALFLGTHFVTSTPARGALVRAMGEWPYRGVYSLVALGTLVWMCIAFAAAPREALWSGPRLLPLFVMPIAFFLAFCGYRRNPGMVGAEKLLKSDDPARGVIRITRHPIMWGVMLWALAHIAARGEVRALLLFGGLFLLAALGTLLMDRRKKANPDWQRFAAVTSNVPFLAIAQGRNRLAWREIGWTLPLAALGAFLLVLFLHPLAFGARPY
jgi:uncharacterized membrane protein